MDVVLVDRRAEGRSEMERSRERRMLGSGDILARLENVIAASEHALGKSVHHWFCLEVEVPEHDIGVPATEKADDISINLGTEKGHGAASAEGAGRDVFGQDANAGSNSGDRPAEEIRDIARSDWETADGGITSTGSKICAQRSIQGGTMVP
jgi:hypothetical protein